MSHSLMYSEAKSSPDVIQQQLLENASTCQSLAQQVNHLAPNLVYIVGRGSSDHAGVFAKYLIETEIGIPVCAAAPSITSVYHRQLDLKTALVLVISQSGRSPDILAQARSAKEGGALVVALVNDSQSPLAELSDAVLPLLAGPEKSVAATKSYLATLSAISQLVAYWKGDEELLSGLAALPDALRQIQHSAPQLTADYVKELAHCVVLGRGFGYAVGREVALKLKEVCGVHAEAFSSAEFLHGPVTLVANKLACIDLHIEDESATAHQDMIEEVSNRGATLAHLRVNGISTDVHPRLQPLAVLQRFYLDIESIAHDMGRDPDQPVGLKKVTQTV